MEVVKILPRGYCHGVITAMHKVSEAISDDSLDIEELKDLLF